MKDLHPCRVGGERSCKNRGFLRHIGHTNPTGTRTHLYQCRVCKTLVKQPNRYGESK